jgi:alpha,alpha-trehalase
MRVLVLLCLSILFLYTTTEFVVDVKTKPENWISHLAEIFELVQRERIFRDSKTFVDVQPINRTSPIVDLDVILHNFREMRKRYQNRDKAVQKRYLTKFIIDNFKLNFDFEFSNETMQTEGDYVLLEARIESLWLLLTREADELQNLSTLIELPYKYIVPGGRFREIYYWDSYFTSVGLEVSDRYDLIESMVKNFIYLLNKLNIIPNGNRIYFTSRSQPPVLALMVDLLYNKYGLTKIEQFIPALEKELNFWNSSDKLVVLRKNSKSYFLTRYFDKETTPRPESYYEDLETARELNNDDERKKLYRNLRSACESGWDFSSRWLDDPTRNLNLATTRTTDFIPVDLNGLLYFLEKSLGNYYSEMFIKYKNLVFRSKADFYNHLAERRKEAIMEFLWDPTEKFFFDYDLKLRDIRRNVLTMAGAVPLFVKMVTPSVAKDVMLTLQSKFLQPFGFVTTIRNDYSNHLQWV